MLDLDPLEQLGHVTKQVDRLKDRVHVTSCSRVRTGTDHYQIDAVVTFAQNDNLQLTFKYERKPRIMKGIGGCHVWYSIEMSQNYGSRENLLVAQVWAPKGVLSTEGPAVCVNQQFLDTQEGEGDEDGWSDMDEDEEEAGASPVVQATHLPMIVSSDDSRSEPPKQQNKKQKTCNTPIGRDDKDEKSTPSSERLGVDNQEDGDNEGEDTCDSFMAYLDPEVLNHFLDAAGLFPMDEGMAFFLLMMFPFYEHEWDLMGYFLDEVFGPRFGNDDDGTPMDLGLSSCGTNTRCYRTKHRGVGRLHRRNQSSVRPGSDDS